MKISFLLSAVVAIAATVISAAPVSSNQAVNLVDPNGNLQWVRPGKPTAQPIPENQRIGNPKNDTSPLKGALPCRSITLFWEIRDYSNGVDDDVLHTFHLQVSIPGGGYNGKTKQVRSTGNAGNNFFNSVQSTDGKWSVTHYGYYYPIHVTLWANGVNHHYYGGNSQWSDWIDDSTGRYYYGEMEFWDCISWYN